MNQPQPMDLAPPTPASRKRKRKPSVTRRRTQEVEDSPVSSENDQDSTFSSPAKCVKLEPTSPDSADDQHSEPELGRIPHNEAQEIEVVKLEKASDDEDEDIPMIIRNQAKSLQRARAAAAAAAADSCLSTTSTSFNHSQMSASPSSAISSAPSAGSTSPGPDTKKTPSKDDSEDGGSLNGKNYKNMSRERRLIANARERTRVHTISTAFDALRQAIPTYSYNQKLSKLAILRIASTYIKSLSALTGDTEQGSFGQCVNECTKTLQMECRARSRRKGRGKD
ncbi:unnamed protein product [Oikopleura dioica]|uniref:Protein atonal homolog 8 n=1 Tax=Oikopleura dioica TaxID=34765 RepID=E4Y2L6_OIKDI|nr:unnamed protein product [Oikopleura dioica]